MNSALCHRFKTDNTMLVVHAIDSLYTIVPYSKITHTENETMVLKRASVAYFLNRWYNTLINGQYYQNQVIVNQRSVHTNEEKKEKIKFCNNPS